MNESVVSVRTAPAKVSTALATIRLITLGRMWRRMMWARLLPMTRARSTNARSRRDSVWLRMIRAVEAQLVIPITTTITTSVIRMPRNSAWAPMTSSRTGARISASTNVGSTRKKSDTRIRIVSVTPPTNPADDADHGPDERP